MGRIMSPYGVRYAEAGPCEGTWNGTREILWDFDVSPPAAYHEIIFCVRDWRGARGMVGPVYFATDLNEWIF